MHGIINTYISNMSYKGYELFYVNGCSHSQGGGLEEPEIRGDSIRPVYEREHKVTWKNRGEVNFAARLSEMIGIPFINEAESGGGTDRVVRMAYKFLLDNWDRKDKIFLILEKPDASRSEVFHNGVKDYYIVNSYYYVEKEEIEFAGASRGYFKKDLEKEDISNRGELKEYFTNHFNIKENWFKVEREFVGLYSFCKQNGIEIKVMTPNDVYFKECFQKKDVVKFVNDEKNYDIATWCHEKKLTISDEIKGYSNDGHPGYFGHIEYAKKLKEFLDKTLEIKSII